MDIKHTIKQIKIIEANYLFIDGMSRSGKAAIAPVISSFKRVEHYKVRATYDRYLMVYESGDLSKQGFKYLFESDLLMDVWFTMMGRDVNNNLHDQTSIINSPKRDEYLARANRKDTPETFDEILKEVKDRNLIFPFVCDDFMTIGSFLSDISRNFKYIVVMRHPIDLVFAWFRSGRGTRLGRDPRYTNPAFQIRGIDNLHYSMINNAEEFNEANPLEKCFLVIEKQMSSYLNNNLLNTKNTFLIPFENYCIEAEEYLKKIEIFLDTERTDFTIDEMTKANVPRIKDNEIFSIKSNMIFDNMKEGYVNRLKTLSEIYENKISNTYEFKKIIKSQTGKYKGLNIEDFSKFSAGSEYVKGKRFLKK